MDLYVDDDGFVRAPALLVYRRLTHVGGWPGWWPGMSTSLLEEDVAAYEDAERFALTLRDRTVRLRMEAITHGWRHEAGFRLALSGDVTGDAEFWLEPAYGGTVVHHVLVGATERRRAVRVLAAYRRVLRRGLWGLKDQLQSEVRQGLGLQP